MNQKAGNRLRIQENTINRDATLCLIVVVRFIIFLMIRSPVFSRPNSHMATEPSVDEQFALASPEVHLVMKDAIVVF